MINLSKVYCLYETKTLINNGDYCVLLVKDYYNTLTGGIHNGFTTLIHSELDSEIYMDSGDQLRAVNTQGNIFAIERMGVTSLLRVDIKRKTVTHIGVARHSIPVDGNTCFIVVHDKNLSPFILDIFGNSVEFGKYSKFGIGIRTRLMYADWVQGKLNGNPHIIIKADNNSNVIGTIIDGKVYFISKRMNKKSVLYRLANEFAESHGLICEIMTYEEFAGVIHRLNPFASKVRKAGH